MRILRSSAVILALFGLLLFVGCQSAEQREADKKSQEEELAKLKGTWTLTSSEGSFADPEAADPDAGDKKDEGPPKGIYYVIEGNILTEKVGDRVLRRKKLTVRSGKDHKQLDLLQVDEKDKPVTYTAWKKGIGKKGKATKYQKEVKEVAIYKIEGDKLTISSSWDDKKRPSGFTMTPDSYVMVLTKRGGSAGDKPEDDKSKEDKGKEDKGKGKGDEKPKEKDKKEEKDD